MNMTHGKKLKSDEGSTTAYWEDSADLIATTPLTRSVEADVCIVGGGIAGLTTAYLLGQQGRRVTVLDDGLFGGGETCRTTAHLSNAIDDRIYRIEKWHGEEKARVAVQSHLAAIDEIERIVTKEDIECDLIRLNGYLIQADESEDDLDEELASVTRLGFTDIKMIEKAPIPSFDSGKCLLFPDQGQFHVVKYLQGIARAIQRDGGTLFSQTRVTGWTGGDRPEVTTENGATVSSQKLVLATNYPLMSKMFAQLPAYRTYAIAIAVESGEIEPALFWDTADPYTYVRTVTEGGKQLLIVGGEDHRTGHENDAEERFGRLFTWAKRRFPVADDIKYKWSGQFFETHDGLAFLGQYSDDESNVYLITGDSGMGMTHGTIGGMLVCDLICGKANPWADVYDPSRLATQSVKEAIPEIISSTIPYTDWVTPGDVSSIDEVKNGQGAVIREGAMKIAVYRDDDGKISKMSAVCTHMGCIVRFNSLEKTWDCPCHGSRFSLTGDVINSPAIEPLKKNSESDG